MATQFKDKNEKLRNEVIDFILFYLKKKGKIITKDFTLEYEPNEDEVYHTTSKMDWVSHPIKGVEAGVTPYKTDYLCKIADIIMDI